MKYRILNKIESLSFFNYWSFFYFVIMLVAVAYNYFCKFDNFSFADMFINYQGGFVRRGLFGEFFYMLHCCGINPVMVAVSLSVVSFLLLASFLVRGFMSKGYALGLLCVSFMLGGFFVFGIGFYRRDFIILCLLLLTVRMWRGMGLKGWFLCGNALTVVAILGYEPYAFVALPVLIALTRLRSKNLLFSFMAWIPSYVAFVACLLCSGNVGVYDGIRRSTQAFLEYPNIIDFLSYDKASVMAFHLRTNFIASRYCVPNIVGSVGSLFVVLYYSANATSMYGKRPVSAIERGNYFMLVMFTMMCQIPMLTVLSTDFTRTCMYSSLSSYMLFFVLSESEQKELLPLSYRKFTDRVLNRMNSLLVPTRLKILFMLLFLGTAQWTGQGFLGMLRESELGNIAMTLYYVVAETPLIKSIHLPMMLSL